MSGLALRRRFVDLASGPVHVARCGQGPPVLLLHQTPRSWDEYRAVLPLLAAQGWHAIAPDTPGFGDSAPLAVPASIEAWAEAMIALADALGLERFAVAGHHTGAATAIELAAGWPDRVAAAVLSAPPLVDDAFRARRAAGPRIDHAQRRADGSHLLALWRSRQPWYPPGDAELLERYVVDALRAGPGAAEGHAVVARYAMEARLPLLRCPALVIDPLADPHAHPHARSLAARIAGCGVVEVDDGRVPLPDQLPERFAQILGGFLRATLGGRASWNDAIV